MEWFGGYPAWDTGLAWAAVVSVVLHVLVDHIMRDQIVMGLEELTSWDYLWRAADQQCSDAVTRGARAADGAELDSHVVPRYRGGAAHPNAWGLQPWHRGFVTALVRLQGLLPSAGEFIWPGVHSLLRSVLNLTLLQSLAREHAVGPGG